jgi:N utilization substance protein B
MLSIFVEIKKAENTFLELSSKMHLASKQDKNPNKKFVNNLVLDVLANSNKLSIALTDRKIDYWDLHSDYIQIFLNEIKNSELYSDYMNNELNDFDEDRKFLIAIFIDIIAPNEKFYNLLEDNKLTWIDDIPLVNTQILKELQSLKPSTTAEKLLISKGFKDADDLEYATTLFKKTVLNEDVFEKEFDDKTPNWDISRIPEIDTILIKMGICEFLKFPQIPTKVTINEYIELAKEYSTPNSATFVNGILNAILKEMSANKKIVKMGKGLL